MFPIFIRCDNACSVFLIVLKENVTHRQEDNVDIVESNMKISLSSCKTFGSSWFKVGVSCYISVSLTLSRSSHSATVDASANLTETVSNRNYIVVLTVYNCRMCLAYVIGIFSPMLFLSRGAAKKWSTVAVC